MILLPPIAPVLVVAPQLDDEMLGIGGTIARLIDAGRDAHIAIVTGGQSPQYSAGQIAQVKQEVAAAHQHLGVRQTHWLEFPAASLPDQPYGARSKALVDLVAEFAPGVIFTPHPGDVHLDHQLSSLSTQVAS